MWSVRDQQQLEAARTIPIDVLKAVAIEQARNSMLSEAYALEVSRAWYEAAETARERREAYAKMPHPKAPGIMPEMNE